MNTTPDTDGIHTIDAHYVDAELAAVHFIVSDSTVAIVDTGTSNSVGAIEAALQERGLTWDDVELIIVTHVHLDHAGGASALMSLCKNAKLVAHPKGARHLIDPEKLIAGSKAVYGEARYQELYGEISPIDKARVIQPQDNEELNFGNRTLRFIHTPGHAYHHHCIVDLQSNSIFTGDTFGAAYKPLRDADNTFVMITTSPTQFDPTGMHQSIDRIMSYQPKALYLTHYGKITPTIEIACRLHEQIDDTVRIAETIMRQANGDKEQELVTAITDYFATSCHNLLPDIAPDVIKEWVKMDGKLNAQGLIAWWNRHYPEGQ